MSWRWELIPEALGAESDFVRTFHVETREQLEKSLQETLKLRDKLIIIEAITDRLDDPPFMKLLAEAVHKAND